MINATTFDHKVHNYENGKLNYIRTDNYQFRAINPDVIVVSRNGIKKSIKVVADSEYTYKMMKTMVKAKDGAEGLEKFMADPFWKDTAVKIINYMIDTMKPAKL